MRDVSDHGGDAGARRCGGFDTRDDASATGVARQPRGLLEVIRSEDVAQPVTGGRHAHRTLQRNAVVRGIRADRDRPVAGVHDKGRGRDETVRFGERRGHIGRVEQVHRTADILLQLVFVHAIHVDARQQSVARDAGELAPVEPGILVVHESVCGKTPHRGLEIIEATAQQRGILHRVEPRDEERIRIGEGLCEFGGKRHLAVRPVVREDQPIGRRRDHVAVDQSDQRTDRVLDDQVRVEGVLGGRADPRDRRRHEPAHVVVDAHEVLHAGNAEAIQRQSRAHSRAAEGDLRVEARGERLQRRRGVDEPLAARS